MEIGTAISAAAQALTIIKEISAIDRNMEAATLKSKIAELSMSLADTKLGLVQAKEDLDAKDKLIAELKRAFDDRSELVEYRAFHYRKSASGKPLGVPYCPKCLRNGQLHMLVSDRPHMMSAIYKCLDCSSTLQPPETFGYEDM